MKSLELALSGPRAQHTRMPSSPPTPTRSRKSSGIGTSPAFTSATPQSNGYPSKRPSNSRRSSQCSVASTSTPRLISSYDRGEYLESFNGFDDLVDRGNANGLGNLADELAEAFDEEDENGHELGDRASEAPYDRAEAIRPDQLKENELPKLRNGSQTRRAISISPVRQATSDLSLSLPKQSLRLRHTRKSSQYDGSDYGDDSDLEDMHGIPASLEARLAAVESLARRGAEANGNDADEIVPRMADALKDLGSQAGIENGAIRYVLPLGPIGLTALLTLVRLHLASSQPIQL